MKKMKTYVGTKELKAIPMNKEEYCQYRQWEVPANENPKEEGYLVEYLDGGKPNDERHLGYISWSPKDVFEKAYKLIEKNNGVLTEGEKRVRKSFNPSLKRVENFKSFTASAIDEIAEVERRVKSASKDNPELGDFLRECATAKTALQDASMWGVAALTHQITFDTFDTFEKLTNE